MARKKTTTDFLNDDVNTPQETMVPKKPVKEDTKKAQIRVLKLFTMLQNGENFTRDQMAEEFNVSERTLQRDMDAIRDFLAEETEPGEEMQEVRYSRADDTYYLDPAMKAMLTDAEAFALIKVLIESRGFNKVELTTLKEKIVDCCIPKSNRKEFEKKILIDYKNYCEPQHKKEVIERVWELEQALRAGKVIQIQYIRNDGKEVKRNVIPAGIIFSEYYFYMLAYIKTQKEDNKEDLDRYPTVYRIDRIMNHKIKNAASFHLPYEKQFSEREFRKRVPFMFTGPLHRVTFYCDNYALEATLDRIPSAEIVERGPKRTLLKAEIYGAGADIWFRGQGDKIEIVKDQQLGKGTL